MLKNGPRLSSRRDAFLFTNRRFVETPCVLEIRVFYKSSSRRDDVRLANSCVLQIVVSSRRRACFVTNRRPVEARRAWLLTIVVSARRRAFCKDVFLQIVVSSRRRAFCKIVFPQIVVSPRRRAFSAALGPYFEAACSHLVCPPLPSGPNRIYFLYKL